MNYLFFWLNFSCTFHCWMAGNSLKIFRRKIIEKLGLTCGKSPTITATSNQPKNQKTIKKIPTKNQTDVDFNFPLNWFWQSSNNKKKYNSNHRHFNRKSTPKLSFKPIETCCDWIYQIKLYNGNHNFL